jgi:hypothetical protein
LTTEQTVPLYKRKYDVGYRGRKYPFWHGRLGLEKWHIAEKFKKQAKSVGLKVNISYRERDRLYGADWLHFLKNCKSVLGVESGASVFDFSGQLSAAVEVYTDLLKKRNEKDGVSYEEVREKYFKGQEDLVSLEQISSRCFEAIATKTMLILYEGSYSGILEPWKHYVPLKKDHSNFPIILDILKDNRKIADITSKAFSEIGISDKYSYKSFINRIDQIFLNEIKNEMLSKCEPYVKREFYEKWPFRYVAYPHGLVPSKKRIIGNKIRRFIPYRLMRSVKSIIQSIK